MYPYISRSSEVLPFDTDDRIAIAATYPKASETLRGATLEGRVSGDGGGIFAAQVVAVNAAGSPVATALTDQGGQFAITGLPAGRYRLYAEPLDGPVQIDCLQGSWRESKAVLFPTAFFQGGPIDVQDGKVYGN